METISVSLDEELLDELNERMDYGDSRSAWIAEAIREKLEREESTDGEDVNKAAADC